MLKIIQDPRLFILLIIISFCNLSCSNIDYNSRSEFKEDKKDNRYEKINSVLKENHINNKNKFVVQYIDFILTESKHYPVLEAEFPDISFKDFLDKAIPTLYYTYSPMLYESVTIKWKKSVQNFIVNYIHYPYGYGERKFREGLKKDLENEKADYLFIFYSEKDPQGAAKGFYDAESVFQLITMWGWDDYFDFGDFKQLTYREQADYLTIKTKYLLKNKGHNINRWLEDLETYKNRWISNGRNMLYRPPLLNMENSTPMNVAYTTIAKKLYLK